jgi:hypothetical protein
MEKSSDLKLLGVKRRKNEEEKDENEVNNKKIIKKLRKIQINLQ